MCHKKPAPAGLSDIALAKLGCRRKDGRMIVLKAACKPFYKQENDCQKENKINDAGLIVLFCIVAVDHLP